MFDLSELDAWEDALQGLENQGFVVPVRRKTVTDSDASGPLDTAISKCPYHQNMQVAAIG